ncbi:MAG TPA: dihydroorotase [Lentimicrobium sp.]|nr:dihydroorotase [Lentimicrobium sp.]
MPKKYYISGATLVNEGKSYKADVLIQDGLITAISENRLDISEDVIIIDASGKYLLPGVIDDQVHFRDPGLTQKGDIYTESKAAVAGGVTSFMDMPNTIPNTLTQELLEEKYQAASEKALANYSFYMGVSNNNLEEVLKTNPSRVCGIKVFLGASTGNMLVDNLETLENLFREAPALIAVHCEDEPIIKENLAYFKQRFGDDIPVNVHHLIRSREACFKSSSFAINLAKKYNTRLHILHLSTADEMALLSDAPSDENKRITAEVCVHHLWFSKEDYDTKGVWIKWNPAIKESFDRSALMKALHDNRIDVIATDHAPHTKDEKSKPYLNCPSGGPLVQHSLVAMLEKAKLGEIAIELVVEKMCHTPAKIFRVERRGFIRTGYHADLVLVDPNLSWAVSKENILYKCGWSPFEGVTFNSMITHTFVGGHLAYENGTFDESVKGKRLMFS